MPVRFAAPFMFGMIDKNEPGIGCNGVANPGFVLLRHAIADHEDFKILHALLLDAVQGKAQGFTMIESGNNDACVQCQLPLPAV